ncbi:hypothetical protein HWV62_16396 [Athelia sp. TMB]|nr:hypothetical protein HWV62_16396 [Athelia sp. TMB]
MESYAEPKKQSRLTPLKMHYLGPAASCPCSISYADSIIIPSSPRSAQIGPKYAHTTSERLHIQANLARVETDLAQLDSALGHLKAAQERLQLKRSILQQYSAEHAALLSPIGRVPPEILTLIFLNLLPKDWTTDSADARRNRMLPSQICQHWRALALATPGLWANISVKVDGTNINRKLKCAKSWLARSGTHPLTVLLSCPEPEYQAQWQSVLTLLLPSSKRWVRASIYSHMPTGLANLKHKLPMLESLEVGFGAWPAHPLFESAPKLRQVITDANTLLRGARLPWAQLTTVELCFSSAQQCLAIMKKLPNVVSFTVLLCNSPNPDAESKPYENPPIRLVNLKHLGVTGEGEDSIPGFYESLELPALSSYTYHEMGAQPMRWKMSSFSSLITRSSCTVTDINMMLASAVGLDDLVLFLQHTPCLKSLHLRSYRARGTTSNSVLQALSIRSAATRIVPQLQHLFLRYDQDFDFQLFADTVESRWKLEEGERLKAPLKTVKVQNIENIGALDEGLLKRLSKRPRGMTILLVGKGGKSVVDWDFQGD